MQNSRYVIKNKIKAKQKAHATLPADDDIKIPLKFVRIEPKIMDNKGKKKNRVLEVIYSFDNSYNVMVGQRLNVYVEVKKNFVGKRPQTMISLAKKGRTAFKKYVKNMRQVFDGLID